MTFKPKNMLPNGMSKNMDQGKLTRPTRLSAKVPKVRAMRGPGVDQGTMRPPKPNMSPKMTPPQPKPLTSAPSGFTSGENPTAPMTPGYSKGGMVGGAVDGVCHYDTKVIKSEG